MPTDINQQALEDLMQNRPSKRYRYDPEIPVSSLCASIGCEKKANHNYPGSLPKYCTAHSVKHMKLQPTRICRHDGCTNYAIYSHSKHRTLNGVYCLKHKSPSGYVNVVRKYCIHCKKLMPALVKSICGKCMN